jgi:hypothetical protein
MPSKIGGDGERQQGREVARLRGENWPSAKYGTTFIQFRMAKKITVVPTSVNLSSRCGSMWI